MPGYGLSQITLDEGENSLDMIPLGGGEGVVIRAESSAASDHVSHVVATLEVGQGSYSRAIVLRIEPHVVVQNMTGIPLGLGQVLDQFGHNAMGPSKGPPSSSWTSTGTSNGLGFTLSRPCRHMCACFIG